MRPYITEPGWSSRDWARIAAAAGVFAIAAILADQNAECIRTFAPAGVITARSVAATLRWLGMDCRREVNTLVHPGGFGCEIDFRCTGCIPAGLLATVILVARGRLRTKLWGAAFGIAGVLLLNWIRLVSLFGIGVFFPRAFGIAHSVIWQVLSVSFLLGFFLVWRRRALAEAGNGLADA